MTDWLKMAAVLVTWIKMAAVLVMQDEALDPLTAARRVNRCGQVQTYL
jgi:hypothetical protein